MLRERTRNGLDAARKEGRIGVRRPKQKMNQERGIVLLVNSWQKTVASSCQHRHLLVVPDWQAQCPFLGQHAAARWAAAGDPLGRVQLKNPG